MSILVFALVIGAGFCTFGLLWRAFTIEMRWEWRLIKLAIHSAIFGAATTIFALLWLGMLRL